MQMLLWILLGGLNNMIRGGLHGSLKQKFFSLLGFELEDGKYIAKNWWQKAIDWLLDGDQLSTIIFGLAVMFMAVTPNDDKIIVAMFVGSIIGWGDYIGALGGWRKGTLFLPEGTTLDQYPKDTEEYMNYKPLQEWRPIDKLIEPLMDRPVLWGLAGMTLRGALWGFLVALATTSWWPLLGGSLMGIVYYVTIKAVGRKYGWTASEGTFGCVFYGTIAKALGV